MRIVLRTAGFVLMLALFAFLPAVLAQENEEISVAGSKIVIEDLFLPLVNSGEADLNFTPDINGTTNGIEAFCSGDVQIAGATRALNEIEETLCESNGVAFKEYLLGYDVLAVIAHPELDFVSCLTNSQLNTIFAPSAEVDATTWDSTGLTDNAELPPISVFLPETTSLTYSFLDDVVTGFGLREDATNPEDIADAVSSTEGAIGVASLNQVEGREDVTIVELNTTQLNACAPPSADTVANREYSAATRLLLYVNSDLDDNETLAAVLEHIFDDASSSLVADAGYTPPTAESMELNRSVLAGEVESGRQITQETSTFEIPSNIVGPVKFSGSSNPADYLASVKSAFTSRYPSVNITINTLAATDAPEAFCGGESDIDILTSSGPLSDELAELCEENEVETATFDFGAQAAILLGNAEDDFTACLTAEQIRTIWGSPSTDEINTWNQVSNEFPEQDIYTFGPSFGAGSLSDLFLAQPDGPVLPLRNDLTEGNNAPLYRATAVSNASGTITFMGWNEYQDVLDEELSGIHPIAIDTGDGCVEPTAESIQSGDYPYIEASTLILNTASLVDRPEVQSVLWYMFSDENFRLIENAGFTGIRLADLPEIRSELEALYEAADILAAQQPATVPDGGPTFNPLLRPSETGILPPAAPASEPEVTPAAEEDE